MRPVDDDPVVTLDVPGALADMLSGSHVASLLAAGELIGYAQSGYTVRLTLPISAHEEIVSAARTISEPPGAATVAARRACTKYAHRVARERGLARSEPR